MLIHPDSMLKIHKLKVEMESWGHDVVAFFGSLLGIKAMIIKAQKKELKNYWESHSFASEVRGRLQAVVLPMLRRRDDITIIAHSMGAIIAYDVLWKISHMCEYRPLRMKLRKKIGISFRYFY